MAFSGAVKLADINDYLGPSQACIKPMLDAKKKESEERERQKSTLTEKRRRGKRKGRGVILEVEYPSSPTASRQNRASTSTVVPDLQAKGHFDQIKTSSDGKTAKITLNDCLACSGCVTSAETVLISEQSLEEFESKLAENKSLQQRRNSGESTTDRPLTIILSISPIALSGIAVWSKLSMLQAATKLNTFLKQIGVDLFFDQSIAQVLSLAQARVEFVKRFRKKSKLPIICSECPGWVCYAEKTQGARVLDHMSNTTSPQQVMGELLKGLIAEEMKLDPKAIYHCAIMPCFDKKLEASRPDFFDKTIEKKDVDCVLTTNELKDLILKHNGVKGLEEVKESPLDSCMWGVGTCPKSHKSTLQRPPSLGASGGYLENIFRYSAKELFDIDIQGELKMIQGRNPDIQEVRLVVGSEEKLNFALAYGFKNIQNVIRKLKRKKSPYHYIEIMACPKGCANGGGQIRPTDTASGGSRELATKVQEQYYKLPIKKPEDWEIFKRFGEWTKSNGIRLDDYLTTVFHDVKRESEASTQNQAEKAGMTAAW
ncbi:hypothetical protein AAMO2058_001268000 [Amorphochlora amoebiformis]